MNQIPATVNDFVLYLSYFGRFQDDVTNNLMELIRNFSGDKPKLKKQSKKVPFIIAECFQNVIRHGEHPKDAPFTNDLSNENFQIGIDENEINITSINIVSREEKENLTEWIEELNGMSQDDLKARKLEILSEGSLSSKGGAGLGLIEMARKSGLPIRASFNETENGRFEFFMTLDIVFGEESSEPRISCELYKSLYSTQKKNKCLITYKGDFSTNSNQELLGLFENHYMVRAQQNPVHLNYFYVIVELLQNVAKHALEEDGEKTGILIVRQHEDHQEIECCNRISNIKTERVNRTFEHILNRASVHQNGDSNSSFPSQTSRLGLGEVANIAVDTIDYRIEKLDFERSFLSVRLKVK